MIPGPAGPLGTTSLFAKITDNLAGLAREAMKVWARQGVHVGISRLE